MGWLKWSRRESSQHGLDSITSTVDGPDSEPFKHKEHASHIERLDLDVDAVKHSTLSGDQDYHFHPTSTPDTDLPFIPSSIIQSSRRENLWLVIDNIVYDCAGFVHPGGATVITSFRGEDCSWQFWRFHNEKHMQEYGRPLRIGRTSGVPNRFEERPKFVGLGKIGADEW